MLDNWGIYGNETYIVFHGYTSTYPTLSLIMHYQFGLSINAYLVSAFIGTIDQLAVLELYGLIFTIANKTGIAICQLDPTGNAFVSTRMYNITMTMTITKGNLTTVTSDIYWKLY